MSRKGQSLRRKVKTHVTRRILLDTFPVENEFYDSQWATWITRIKEGQSKEEESIKRLMSGFSGDDAGEWFADDYYHSVSVTDNMYATLIVSIWSKMESYFKRLSRFSYSELGRTGDPPYKIDKIKAFFLNNLNIDLGTIKKFKTINAIRILNNSFKHENGKYKPRLNYTLDHIDSTLLHQWNLEEGKRIEYSNLPIQDLVIACNTFTTELFKRVETELKNRAASNGGS